jgi:hypothetical protein
MNRPTVNTPEAVQEILEQYDLQLELQVVTGSEAGTGVLAFEEDAYAGWPSAVRVDELPDVSGEDKDERDDEWYEACHKLHVERGQQGLTDMLLALAPHLSSPLVVQVATFDPAGSFGAAKEWTVRPGATEVEVKEIVGMDDKYAIAEMG